MSQRQRIVVTGREGQIVCSLLGRATAYSDFEIVAVGRPSLDLARPHEIADVLHGLRPALVVSAAAYTAVDQAETDEDKAMTINAVAAGEIASAAAQVKAPIIHLSTDYVFDGKKSLPYTEDDPVGPLGVYGRSKLAGEIAVAQATDNHVILRTAWVYSPFGRNFLKTMLQLAEHRAELNVVDDQIGNPSSALDLADGILAVATNLLNSSSHDLRGTFHIAGSGAASWADFAEEIFHNSRRLGGPSADVRGIASRQYPTKAQRPGNSQLCCKRLAEVHGVLLPDWRRSTQETIEALRFGENKA